MIAIPYYNTSYFVFSNFSAHTVRYNGITYPTAEHAFHGQKFDDSKIQEQIRDCGSPLEAWDLARELKPRWRDDWDKIKTNAYIEIVRAKVAQHKEVQTALLATKNEEIVEVNAGNDLWGSGREGRGQNKAGKLLMEIRAELNAT